MGRNLAKQAIEKGYDVVGLDKKPPENTEIKITGSISELKEQMTPPRIILLYVPAGKIVDQVLEDLENVLEEGDIVVDGGNSYWGDSIRRAKNLAEKGIHFLDCGTSGGIRGARRGACFMIGGAEKAVAKTEHILKDLAVPGGYVYTGPSGTGHFVKLVHNGIEFGMLQAIAEGINLLEEHPEDLDIPAVLHCWSNGSVIRSWLIDLMKEQMINKGSFNNIPDYVEDTGEVNWLVNDAMHMEVPVPVIAQSVMQLIQSRQKKKVWASAIAMMRHGFGEHPFGKNEHIQKEREEGKVGSFPKSILQDKY